MNEGRRFGRLACLFGLFVVVLYADPLFVRKNFGGRDLLGYNLPIERVVHDAYAHAALPIWISEVSGGRPLAANPNVGAFYPVRPILSVFSFPMAMRLFPVLHWTLAGLGMILLLLAIGVSAEGAWLGAVAYVFSGVGVSEVIYTNHHPGVALLPWVVWAVSRSDWPEGRRVVVVSFLLGIDLLAGDVFTAGLALLAASIWIALENEGSRRGRSFLALAGASGLAGLLALPQILATALWVPETGRAVAGFRLGDALELSLTPWRLLELIVPFPFGDTWRMDSNSVWGISALSGRTSGFFSTLFAGAFAPIALWMVWRQARRGVRAGRALLLAGILLAVPGSFLPASWRTWPSPLPVRHPEKFAVLIVFALAMFVALGWDRIREGIGNPRLALAIGSVLTGVAVGARLFPLPCARAAVALLGGSPQRLEIAADRIAPAFAEAGLYWMGTVIAIWAGGRRGRFARAAALLLLTAVPVLANRRIAPTFRQEEVLAPTAFARWISRRDPSDLYRTLALPASISEGAEWSGRDVGHLDFYRRSWLYDTPALWGRGTVFNQDADEGDLSRAASLRRLAITAAGFSDSQSFFGSFGLRWEIRFRGEPARAGYRSVGGDALQSWDELDSAFPTIRLLTRWREERSAVGALTALPRLGPGEVTIETGVERAGTGGGGAVHLLAQAPERLLLETDAPTATWLFVLRGYFPYRTVLLDGRAIETSPAQLAFSAVPVPAGKHRIDWREDLPGSAASRWGPPVYAIAALALLRRRDHIR